MKVSVRQNPAEKGHLNFDKRCCAPQTHREPFGDAGRHAKPSPDYTRGLLAFWAAAAQANLHRQSKANKTFPFTQANLHLFALLRGLEAKKRERRKKQTAFRTKLTRSCFLPGRARYRRLLGRVSEKYNMSEWTLPGSLISLGLSGPDKEAPARVDVTQGRGCD